MLKYQSKKTNRRFSVESANCGQEAHRRGNEQQKSDRMCELSPKSLEFLGSSRSNRFSILTVTIMTIRIVFTDGDSLFCVSLENALVSGSDSRFFITDGA